MFESADIGKICRKYIIQLLSIVVLLTVASFLVMHWMHVQNLLMPTCVSAVFTLVSGLAEILLWKRIAGRHAEGLPTFFTAVSGCRMLLGLFTLLICYVIAGKAMIVRYCAVFLCFYFISLIHSSLYFSRLFNAHDTKVSSIKMNKKNESN